VREGRGLSAKLEGCVLQNQAGYFHTTFGRAGARAAATTVLINKMSIQPKQQKNESINLQRIR
jgi:hypothetical protein